MRVGALVEGRRVGRWRAFRFLGGVVFLGGGGGGGKGFAGGFDVVVGERGERSFSRSGAGKEGPVGRLGVSVDSWIFSDDVIIDFDGGVQPLLT